jgi:hypothetical protein
VGWDDVWESLHGWLLEMGTYRRGGGSETCSFVGKG